MKQQDHGQNLSSLRTRKAVFLATMDTLVPWTELLALIALCKPGPKQRFTPFGWSPLLRIHFLQQWFDLSDLAMEEALLEVPMYREFAGLIDVEHIPNRTVIRDFRHFLEEHQLTSRVLAEIHATHDSVPRSTQKHAGEHASHPGMAVEGSKTIQDINPPRTKSGRPAHPLRRRVSDDLMRAAETCLAQHSPQDISSRDISAMAKTRPAMVNYYFGSKDGLLREIVENNVRELEQIFINTREAILSGKTCHPTRTLLTTFADICNHQPALCRMLISEAFRDGSVIRNHFLDQWPRNGWIMIEDALRHLCANGYYRPDVDVDAVCSLIHSMVFFPLVISPTLVRDRHGGDINLTERWIDFSTEVLDRYLRPDQA